MCVCCIQFDHCLDLCDHHHSQDTEWFHHMDPSGDTLLQYPVPENHESFSISIILLFQKYYLSGIILYPSKKGWNFSLRTISLFFVYISKLFLLLSNISKVQMYQFVSSSPVEGHQHYFQYFAIRNKDAMNIRQQFSVLTLVFFFFFSGINAT